MQPPTDDSLPEATDELLDKYRLKFSVMVNKIAGGCLVNPRRQDYHGRQYYDLDQSEALTITSMVKLLLKRVETDKVDLAAGDFEVKQLTERNQALQQKAASTDGKLGKLMSRVNGLQGEVDAFQRWKIEHTEKLKGVNAEVPGMGKLQNENQRLKDELEEMKIKRNILARQKEELIMDVQTEQRKVGVFRLENQALTAHLQEATNTNEAQQESSARQLDHVSLFVRVLLGVYPEVDIFYVRNLIQELLTSNEDE